MKNENSQLTTAKSTEAAFYSAFAHCDMAAMAAVWDEEGAVCIHPGAAAATGREAVLRSWSGILEQAAMPELRVVLLSRTEHDGLAVHVVEEHIGPVAGGRGTVVVLATNVYRRRGGTWRILEHHASAVPERPAGQHPLQ